MKPEQLKQIITIVVEGLEQKIEGLSSEISTVKSSIPNVERVLAKLKPRLPVYGKDWKLTREEIEQIADKIKPIAGRDFEPPKDGKDAEITDELISRIAKMVQAVVVNGRDGIDGTNGRDGKDGKDGVDGMDADPDDLVGMINLAENKIDIERIDVSGIEKQVQDLRTNVQMNLQALPITTSFVNGRRAKNFNFTGVTPTYEGDTVTIAVSGGGGATTPASPDTSIQFNNAGAFGGDANFTFDSSNETVLLTGTDIFVPSAGSVVFGAGAGNHTLTGTDNILIGGKDDGFANVGLSLTTGEENVFIGKGTGRMFQSASRNVVIGSDAGSSTGSAGTVGDNVVIGRGAGKFLGLASGVAAGNVLIGQGTGTQINASYNVAIGYQAMGYSTAAGNIAIGFSALSATTSGNNIGIGDSVGQNITTGTANILIGSISGNSLATTSSNNTFVGHQTGTNNEGNRNTFVGSLAGAFPLGDDNTAIGYNTFNASGSGLDQTIQSATVLGSKAMKDPRTGADFTTAIGYEALTGLTTGQYNTALGAGAGYAVTTGSFNTFLGANAGQALTLGAENTFIGLGAGAAMTGASNITSSNFIAGMYASVLRTQGNFNTIIGTRADGVTASTGDGNTIIGYGTAANLTSGASNIIIGTSAGNSITTGQGIFIGVGADGTASGVGQIAIGAGATTTASNQFVVGSVGTPINDYYFGEGVTSASPSDITFNASGGSGTDIAGADFILAGGKGTGNAAGGSVFIQTSATGSTGTTLQTLQTNLEFDKNRNIRASGLHDNTTAQGNATQQDIRSGTYTPTLTAVTNVTATTARKCQWMRVGNVVTVSGQCDIDPTGVGTVVLGISLPVASNFGTAFECGGVGHAPAVAGHGSAIYADATNNRAELSYVDGIGSNDTMTFTFTYEVL